MTPVSDDPQEWTAEQFQTGIANALAAGDMKFVSAALTLMALVHPHEAALTLDTLKVGVAIRGDSQ